MKCEAIIYEKLYGDIITKMKFINEHFAKKWMQLGGLFAVEQPLSRS